MSTYKVSSTGIRKGLSVSRTGVGIEVSIASIKAKIASRPNFGSPPIDIEYIKYMRNKRYTEYIYIYEKWNILYIR